MDRSLPRALTGLVFLNVLWSIGGSLMVVVGGHALAIPGYLVLGVGFYAFVFTTATMVIGRRLPAMTSPAPVGSALLENDDSATGVADRFVTASDLLMRAHLDMRTTLQPFIDNSISETINVPRDCPFSTSGMSRSLL